MNFIKTYRTVLILFRGCLLIGWWLASVTASAQSAMFSQYYFSPMNVNPALLGAQPHLTAGLQHRAQWRNLAHPHRASLLLIVKPVAAPQVPDQQRGGIGLTLVNESLGTALFYRSTEINLGAAYNLNLDRAYTHQLSFGLQGGYTQRRLDAGQLRWGSQYDPTIGYNPEHAPSLGTLNERVGFATFRAGLVYHYNPSRELLLHRISGFAGFSVSNLNRPHSSFSATDPRREARVLRAHSGLEIPLSMSVRLLPQVLVAYQDAQRHHVNVGTYVHYRFARSPLPDDEALRLMAGAWYRWQDAWVGSAGVAYRQYQLAVSYDFNTQPVAVGAFRGGAFEVSLAYRWLNRKFRRRNFSTPMI